MDPVELGLSIIYTANKLYDNDVRIYEHVNQLAGIDLYEIMDTNADLETILTLFETPANLADSYTPYYLYPTNDN